MTKPSVRQSILRASVQRLLDDGEQLHAVVMLSTRHRWFIPYALASGLALYLVAISTGVESLLDRSVVAACGIAVAGLATTNHTVLAATDQGFVLCRSSRIRQYAKQLARRLPPQTPLIMVGSTVITSDWKIDGVIYTLTKRWEATMRQLATAQSADGAG